jgi:hypothetical protein
MFPSFDDRVQEIQPYHKAITEIGEKFGKGEFPIFEILELGVPLIPKTNESRYSDRQLKGQEYIKNNPRWVRRFLSSPIIPPTVKVPVALTVAFIAYGTGGRGPAQWTPEIQAYDESAFDYLGPGNGYGTMI